MQILNGSSQGLLVKNIYNSLDSFLSVGRNLPQSTFYNILSKIEQAGFIVEIERKREGKVYGLSDLGKIVVKMIGDLSFFGSLPILDYARRILPELKSKLTNQSADNLLIINFEENIDTSVINELAKMSSNVSLMADEETFARYKARNLEDYIKQTKLDGSKIREPMNYFDTCAIMNFESGRYKILNHRDLLKEAYRTLKPDGTLIINAIREINKNEHVLVEYLIDRIEATNYIKPMMIDELKEILVDTGFVNIDIMDFNGILIGFATKR